MRDPSSAPIPDRAIPSGRRRGLLGAAVVAAASLALHAGLLGGIAGRWPGGTTRVTPEREEPLRVVMVRPVPVPVAVVPPAAVAAVPRPAPAPRPKPAPKPPPAPRAPVARPAADAGRSVAPPAAAAAASAPALTAAASDFGPMVDAPTPAPADEPDADPARGGRPATDATRADAAVRTGDPVGDRGEAPPRFADTPARDTPARDTPAPDTPASDTPAPVATVPAAEPPAHPLPPLPGSRSQRFRVFWGDYTDRVSVARLQYTLVHDGERYEIRTEGEAEGLISLVYSGMVVQVSAGRLGPRGLEPLRYAEQRGKRAERAVAFDPDGGRLLPAGGLPAVAMPAGTQDRLSVFYQIGLVARSDPAAFVAGSVRSLPVASLRGVETQHFQVIGDEVLLAPGGPIRALHLRRPAPAGRDDPLIDLWLGYDFEMLPVRLRIEDAGRRVLDQVIERDG